MAYNEVEAADRVVLLGASAGGVEAISTVVAGLPGDLPAAVLVVLHVPAWGTSVLPSILDRAGPLPSRHAVDAEPLLASRIYVAPPDHHLTIEDGTVKLSLGPKENGVRPSVDALFRSAAHSHGPSVVASVLSGTLDDGTAGMISVRAHGGIGIVEDPSTALFPSMPESASRFANPDHVVPRREVAALIAKLVTADPDPGSRETDGGIHREAEIAPTDEDHSAHDEKRAPSGLTCPECHGALWERHNSELLRFRCRVGHAHSPGSLFSHQLESVGALWAAVVALEERAELAERLAARMTGRGLNDASDRYHRQARDARRRAEQVQEAILQLTRTTARAATKL